MAASARKVILAMSFCLGMVAEISLYVSRGITSPKPRYEMAPRPTQDVTHQQHLLGENHDVNMTLQEEIPDDLKTEPDHGVDTTSLKKILVWNDPISTTTTSHSLIFNNLKLPQLSSDTSLPTPYLPQHLTSHRLIFRHTHFTALFHNSPSKNFISNNSLQASSP
ncbi:uncharacterized protein LOC119579851 [Penaeus monodon]|uniref:uncharacterized protein LOC119579851 n=1 Tax=Penaeus monodon TaxID=6687 RepID=UPI0018A7D513|nr:uncharacterized protein LOC119579851 [Penaeus monodon]